jgi:hypothetical protein
LFVDGVTWQYRNRRSFWVAVPIGDDGGRKLARMAGPRVIAGLRSMILFGDAQRCERL